MKRVHLVASGLVQGVFFRASVRDEARRLGVTGWTRNLPSGSVEVEVQGEEAAVDALVAAIRRGPGSAVVEDLRLTNTQPLANETTFEVRP